MKRYSVMARPYQQDREVELCQCDSNPDAIVAAAQQKTIKIDRGDRKVLIDKYEHVYFVDHEAVTAA